MGTSKNKKVVDKFLATCDSIEDAGGSLFATDMPIKSMNKAEKLKIIEEEAEACQRCSLYKTRNKLVFHRGNPDSKIIFLGEAAGFNEDQTGEPFCGRSGKLLDKMVEAMGLTKDDVYVCNVLNCRPPNNRKPEPGEIKSCKKFLDRQLAAVSPKVIVALGATATEAILGPGPGITRRRGKVGKYQGIPVVPSLHPAYLLRTPKAKMDAKDDLKSALDIIKYEDNNDKD